MKNQPKWISCYIFHDISFEKVLIELIKPLIDKLKESNYSNEYFFIRYWENGPHVRLRIFPKNKLFTDEIIDVIKITIKSYFDSLKKELNYTVKFNDYVQEIQRYGGDDNMKIAEKHFQHSSNIVLSHISYNNNNRSYSNAISFAIQMHLIFAKKLIVNKKDSILYFDSLQKKLLPNSVKLDENNKICVGEINKVKTFFTNSYKSQKKTIDFIAKNIWDKEFSDSWMKEWSNSCSSIKRLIEETYSKNKLLKPEWFELNKESNLSIKNQIFWSIYDSYIHMTNNRLGIHLRDEAFIAFLILKGLESISSN